MNDNKRLNGLLPRRNKAAALSHGLMSVLLTTTSLVPVLVPAFVVTPSASAWAGDALPTGGQVASGSVSIGTSGTTTTVTQGSDTAIVNWKGFSIGQGHTVDFVQPGSSSAILNRVTGSATSAIAGSLTGNGQVYLVNPNGIAITSTGTVKVGGGFVASTLDISNDDFLKGRYRFTGSGSSAGVSNDGVITVGRGGYAALIGGTVKNNGLIAVPVGKVGLGSAEQATLDLSGDGFLQVALPTKAGAEGTGALVENSGTISALGGTVVMRAATARDAARHAINLSGVVEANSISGHDGAITIGGGDGGRVAVSGKVTASSATGKGGKITVTGKSVALKGATVNASGTQGGGTVKIGGDYQGHGTTQRAETVSIDASSTIRADATDAGNGGTVVVWSDQLTTFDGLISARGAGAGAGGDAEVSGKAVLAYNGFTDLSGPGGFGNLLLDPYNITISNGAASNSSGTTATGNDSVINVSTLESALSAANVTVTTGGSGSAGSQAGSITVAAPIAWSSGSKLTLSAAGNIAIDADITATGANAGLVLNYGGSDYSIGSGASVTLSGASSSLSINGTSYTLIHSAADLEAVNNNVSGSYALAADLNLAGASYSSSVIGRDIFAPFSGTFAGLGHAISNLKIYAAIQGDNPENTSFGLFSQIYGGTVRDLDIVNGSVRVDVLANTGAPYEVGLLAGTIYYGKIKNVYASGSVWTRVNFGYSTASNPVFVGGLIGLSGRSELDVFLPTTTIDSVSADVAVDADEIEANLSVGGLLGAAVGNTRLNNTYSAGDIYAVSYGSVVHAGGLVGLLSYGASIKNSYATGDVLGLEIHGSSDGDNSGVGGLVGLLNQASISNAYATGAVRTLGDNFGGLVGYNLYGYGTITASFYNTQTTGRANGVGNSSSSGVTGLTTAQMHDGSTSANSFYTLASAAGWDFTKVWARPNAVASQSSDGQLHDAELYALSGVVGVSASGRMTYGDASAVVSTTLYGSGSSYGNLVITAPNYSSLVTSSSDVGTYAITFSGGSGRSSDGKATRFVYYPSSVEVTPATLTVTASNATKTYDGLAYTGGNGVTYSGFVNNEGAGVLGGTLAYGGTAQGAVNAGTYGLSASGLTSGNYNIIYQAGALTITAAATPPVATPVATPTTGIIGSLQTTFTRPQSAFNIPQILTYGTGASGAAGGFSTEDARLSGAICVMGPNFVLSCGAN